MFPQEYDGVWIVSRGIPLVSNPGIGGGRGESVRVPVSSYEAWDGLRWGLPSVAMRFATRAAAERYMEENQQRLEP